MLQSRIQLIADSSVPFNSSDDGRILLHDGRAKNRLTRAQSTLQNNTEFTDVRSHPLVEHLFATSDSHGKVCLRDSRMAFGPLVNRTREGIVRIVSTVAKT
jgi:DDB1- and CUL4-associated factor 5